MDANTRRRNLAAEIRTDLDTAVERLTLLGATPEELAEVVDRWDDFDDQWTPQARREWLRSTDQQLITELQAARMEYSVGTTTEEEHLEEVSALEGEVAERIGGSVDSILVWVGDDVERTSAVLAAEMVRPEPRTTLVGPLTKRLQALEP